MLPNFTRHKRDCLPLSSLFRLFFIVNEDKQALQEHNSSNQSTHLLFEKMRCVLVVYVSPLTIKEYANHHAAGDYSEMNPSLDDLHC